MALINCQRCNRAYSSIKDTCPFCGYNPKEEDLRREIIKQSAEMQNKTEVYQTQTYQQMPPRKSQATAAALSFFFWWVGADVFYTKGFMRGVGYLLFIYLIIPIICFCLPLAFNASQIAWGMILVLMSQGLIFIFSVIKALYYLSMKADKFHSKYK